MQPPRTFGIHPSRMTVIEKMPQEILAKIFSDLDVLDIRAVRLVSRAFCYQATDSLLHKSVLRVSPSFPDAPDLIDRYDIVFCSEASIVPRIQHLELMFEVTTWVPPVKYFGFITWVLENMTGLKTFKLSLGVRAHRLLGQNTSGEHDFAKVLRDMVALRDTTFVQLEELTMMCYPSDFELWAVGLAGGNFARLRQLTLDFRDDHSIHNGLYNHVQSFISSCPRLTWLTICGLYSQPEAACFSLASSLHDLKLNTSTYKSSESLLSMITPELRTLMLDQVYFATLGSKWERVWRKLRRECPKLWYLDVRHIGFEDSGIVNPFIVTSRQKRKIIRELGKLADDVLARGGGVLIRRPIE